MYVMVCCSCHAYRIAKTKTAVAPVGVFYFVFNEKKEDKMKLGIVGLPNVGKSTLFNAITHAKAEMANYPFCTIDPNVGLVKVPDERLQKLADMYNSQRIVHAAIEFYDIAGLVRGASKGEGLGNQFLSHIREVDAIVEVLRCFEDENVVHVDGSVDPIRDIETIHVELMLADLEIVEKKREKIRKVAKADKAMRPEADALEKVYATLSAGKSARTAPLSKEEWDLLRGYGLLSAKPMIFVANVAEAEIADDGANNPHVAALRNFAQENKAEVVVISAEIEAEIAALDDADRAVFMDELGLHSSGLDRLIVSSYDLLGLMSFLTAGPQEVRAWTIRKGTPAVEAAGKIHTDIQRGFIRAETISYPELMQCGSMQNAKEKGLVRLEGKDYILQEGDIVLFRFNV